MSSRKTCMALHLKCRRLETALIWHNFCLKSVRMETLKPGDILKLYLSQWKSFAALFLGLLVVSLAVYIWKVPYVASGSIISNDNQNSGLQAFSASFYGMNKSLQDGKKGNTVLTKHLEYLKTQEFYSLLAQKAMIRGQSAKITLDEVDGFKKVQNILKSENAVSFLASAIQVKLDSDFQIKISAKSADKNIALFLTNAALEVSQIKLKERELSDIQTVDKFIVTQKSQAEENLKNISKELANYEAKDEDLLPLASQSKMGDYVSELLVRANELKLKIAENNKMIEMLAQGRPSSRESKLYGVGGRIEALRIENKMLQGKLGQLQASIDRLKKQTKQMPFAAQMVQDLKKKSEIEFAKFKELSEAQSRLEAQKLSIETRFEILERATPETTAPQVGLMILVGLAAILSQIIGSLIVYFRFLWNPETITGTAERNLVIFNDHSFDPRVIIENSKIKFSLNNIKKTDTDIIDDSSSEAKS